MKKFIESIFVKKEKIEFNYKQYDVLFVRKEFNMFYLFFFIEEEQELLNIRAESAEIYRNIKSNKDIYVIDMDKNIACIYCLKVSKDDYYNTETTGTVSALSKKVCLVEEDLNFFKKNVLLYTEEMHEFAKINVGRFDYICKEMITEKNFQKYKNENAENYRYDLLINLFIKLPFLNFQKYQLDENLKYKSVKSFIEEECEKMDINKDFMQKEIRKIEGNFQDEDRLYNWIDKLVEMEEPEKNLAGGIEDEN